MDKMSFIITFLHLQLLVMKLKWLRLVTYVARVHFVHVIKLHLPHPVFLLVPCPVNIEISIHMELCSHSIAFGCHVRPKCPFCRVIFILV